MHAAHRGSAASNFLQRYRLVEGAARQLGICRRVPAQQEEGGERPATFGVVPGQGPSSKVSTISLAEGHTVRHHSYSHPLLDRMSISKAETEIDRGIAADEFALFGRRQTPYFVPDRTRGPRHRLVSRY